MFPLFERSAAGAFPQLAQMPQLPAEVLQILGAGTGALQYFFRTEDQQSTLSLTTTLGSVFLDKLPPPSCAYPHSKAARRVVCASPKCPAMCGRGARDDPHHAQAACRKPLVMNLNFSDRLLQIRTTEQPPARHGDVPPHVEAEASSSQARTATAWSSSPFAGCVAPRPAGHRPLQKLLGFVVSAGQRNRETTCYSPFIPIGPALHTEQGQQRIQEACRK